MIAADVPGNPVPRAFAWLDAAGVGPQDLAVLSPCVPGEFMTSEGLYVNSASPGIVFEGTEEATLPLVVGRWYFLPGTVVDRHPALRKDARPVAQAPRLIG